MTRQATPPATELPPGWPVMSLTDAETRLTATGSPFEIDEMIVAGRPQKVWKNAPPTLRDLFLVARTHGSKTWVVYEDERASFEAFARASLAMAHHLAGLGVRKGDRVALAMRNLPEWTTCAYGALLNGAIFTPLNAWWTGAELEYGLRDSGARILIVDAERLERLAPHLDACPALEHVLVSRLEGGAPALTRPLTRVESVLGPTSAWSELPDRPLPDVSIEADDDATIFYTSGTTGHPKGAVGSHRSSALNALNAPFSVARSYLRRGEALPTPDPAAPQKVTLLSIPFFHTTGFQAVLNTALYSGTRLVLMHRWHVEKAMQLIETERVTSAGGVPTIAWQLIEHPERGRYDLSSLEHVSYGGAPASTELVRRIKEVFPKAAPGLGWGMTETTSTFTSHSGEEYVNRPESSGPALPLCRMKILDEHGSELPAGEIGELVVYGPQVVRAYWGKPEATADTFRDGWLHTGDLCWLDEEGFLYVVDRKKDMLIRGGENIYCIEVESALYAHPAVMDAAVLALPHKTLGEEPAAIVTLKPGQSVDEAGLRAFVASRIAAFKVPVRIVFIPDMLPRNANGKIMKNGLRALLDKALAPTLDSSTSGGQPGGQGPIALDGLPKNLL